MTALNIVGIRWYDNSQGTERKHMQCHGTVQGNVVILEEGVSLPDGLRVTVTVEQETQPAPAAITQEALAQRHTLGKQMQAFGQRLAGRRLHLGDLIREGREELEDRA